jgi:hypothetical protein
MLYAQQSPSTPIHKLRFLADITNRGDSPEAMKNDYAGQLANLFPGWLERGRTRTVYEFHPVVPWPPESLEEFLDPDYFAAFLKRVPEWLAVYNVTSDFDGVLAWDLETFTSRVELSTKGTGPRWAGRYPNTPYALGFETAVARVMAEFGRYIPRAKRTVWGFPWCAPWLDRTGPASVLLCRTLNQKWGPALARSFDVLNPAMYPFNTTDSMRPLFDEVAFLTNQVRGAGVDAFADVCATYPTGALPADQQPAQPAGGASRVPTTAAHLDEACQAAISGHFTGVTIWAPIWDRADFEAKARWMRETFIPVSRRYIGAAAAEAA